MEISERLFISNSISVTAEVVQIDKKKSKGKNYVFRPVLEIEKPDGSTYRYNGSTWIYPNPHTVGEVVPASYSAEDGRIVSRALSAHESRIARIFMAGGAGYALFGFVVLLGHRARTD